MLEGNVMRRCWQPSPKSTPVSAWFEEGLAMEQSDLHLCYVGVSVGGCTLS